MKLRLTQKGFEHYNGQMGVLVFEDGLSTTDPLLQDAIRISAAMLCEWEDGSSPNIAQSIVANGNTPAPMFETGANGQHDTGAARIAPPPQTNQHQAPKWSKEQLEAVADEKGIKGLREIADPLGIKGTAITDLIAAILQRGN